MSEHKFIKCPDCGSDNLDIRQFGLTLPRTCNNCSHIWRLQDVMEVQKESSETVEKIKETDDWKLSCYLDWTPKRKTITCPSCNGKGTIGGHFKDIEGLRDCDECWGTKIKSVLPTSTKPEIPQHLAEHMRRAWWDYFNS